MLFQHARNQIHAIVIFFDFIQSMSVSISHIHSSSSLPVALLDSAADTARDTLGHIQTAAKPSRSQTDKGKSAPQISAEAVRNTLTNIGTLQSQRPNILTSLRTNNSMSRLTMALHSDPKMERRRSARYPYCLPCELIFDGQTYSTETLDIGRRGLHIVRPNGFCGAIGQTGLAKVNSTGSMHVRIKGMTSHGLNLVVTRRISDTMQAALNGLLLRLRGECDFQAGQARMMAATVTRLFETEVASGHITAADLFDRRHLPVACTSPQQFTTRATPFYDRVLPAVLERAYSPSIGMVYAVVCDRDGYIPVHNTGMNQPQRPDDIDYNLRFSRNRRIYDDNATLRSARFARDVVIQTYIRDLENDPNRIVKSVAAPIHVHGQRWGCVNIGFAIKDIA